MAKKLLLLMLIGLLSGCGFHLRGQVPLAPPMYSLYLQTPAPYGQLARELKQYLKMSGVKLVDSPAQAETVLAITSEDKNDELISVGGTQQTRQYNLILSVTFEVRDSEGRVLIPQQLAREVRMITIQSDEILGGSNEETNMYKQMNHAIVFDIMNLLSSQNSTAALMYNISKLPKAHEA